jgi:hypothetical protein
VFVLSDPVFQDRLLRARSFKMLARHRARPAGDLLLARVSAGRGDRDAAPVSSPPSSPASQRDSSRTAASARPDGEDPNATLTPRDTLGLRASHALGAALSALLRRGAGRARERSRRSRHVSVTKLWITSARIFRFFRAISA